MKLHIGSVHEKKKIQKQIAEDQLADCISTVIDKNKQSIQAVENPFKKKQENKKVKSAEAKKSNEAMETMKEIEARKKRNMAEPKDIPFSWIRKILEDKKTLKAGKDEQAIYN